MNNNSNQSVLMELFMETGKVRFQPAPRGEIACSVSNKDNSHFKQQQNFIQQMNAKISNLVSGAGFQTQDLLIIKHTT